MISVNRVILCGRLGRDPDTAGRDGSIVKFSLATSRSWRDKASGERRERTQWHDVVVYNEQAGKFASQYLRKGDMAYVEGELETREYETRDGEKRRVTEVIVQPFLGSVQGQSKDRRDDGDGSDAGGETRHRPSGGREATGSKPTSTMIDDDIPF